MRGTVPPLPYTSSWRGTEVIKPYFNYVTANFVTYRTLSLSFNCQTNYVRKGKNIQSLNNFKSDFWALFIVVV